MKATLYLRLAKHPRGRDASYKVAAGVKPSREPLWAGDQPLPTVAFAVKFDIPDAAFNQAERVIAEIAIPEDELEIAADVKQNLDAAGIKVEIG